MLVRLLIVDDHEDVRLGLRNLIESSRPDWQICGEAEDGAKAVAKVQELAPDVVILDLAMPVVNGAQAAIEIRQVAPTTKIILFSAHDVPASVWNGCADAFVSKLAFANWSPRLSN